MGSEVIAAKKIATPIPACQETSLSEIAFCPEPLALPKTVVRGALAAK